MLELLLECLVVLIPEWLARPNRSINQAIKQSNDHKILKQSSNQTIKQSARVPLRRRNRLHRPLLVKWQLGMKPECPIGYYGSAIVPHYMASTFHKGMRMSLCRNEMVLVGRRWNLASNLHRLEYVRIANLL